MNATDRRMEIISTLVVNGHIVLQQENWRRNLVSVCARYATTLHTSPMVILFIQSRGWWGTFIMDTYKPYNNMLSSYEQEKLKEMYDEAEGDNKKSWNGFSENMDCIS